MKKLRNRVESGLHTGLKQKSYSILLDIIEELYAVRKGFEPPKRFLVYTLSKRAP